VYDAFLAGGWSLFWTPETLYWVAKPTVHVEVGNFGRRLHCPTGPALISDPASLYFWHGVHVEEHVIMAPGKITVAEVRAEENAEVRRVLIERMGASRYLFETGAKVIDTDVESVRKGAAPRVLLADDRGDKWLVGTDGGTKRVYYMPVPRNAATCRQAHRAIAGFDERRILAKS
jgi:hypothetical protein